MVGWQKFTRHLDKILHDRGQKLALMPRQMNGILKRKIRKIDPGNGTESQLSFEHSAWQNCDAKPQADGFENGLLRGAFPGRGDLTAGLADGILKYFIGGAADFAEEQRLFHKCIDGNGFSCHRVSRRADGGVVFLKQGSQGNLFGVDGSADDCKI